MKLPDLFNRHPFFIRLFHWEYWSFHCVYGPIYIVFALLVVRAGFRYFFSASNPGIQNGGFLMEEKDAIYAILPDGYYPLCFKVPAGSKPDWIEQQVAAHAFSFPLIAKPNIGMQGKAVKKVHHMQELLQYAAVCKVDFLVQQLSPYTKEVGVFYHRMPGSTKGQISGIVAKEPMQVTGDGSSSLYQLICREPRYLLQMNQLQQMYGDGLLRVLPAGEQLLLAPYGNHARGSKFVDWSHLADPVLTARIDLLCQQIPGFYYGRLDIMYDDWEGLQNGRFHIIELNGAGSDPTHMYDPSHSLLFAWKEIIRHWLIMYRISKANHQLGHSYMSLREGAAMFRANNQLVQQLDAIAKLI